MPVAEPIQKIAGDRLRFTAALAQEAAVPADQAQPRDRREFDMLVYSGEPVQRLYGTMVLDLGGYVPLERERMPVLFNHGYVPAGTLSTVGYAHGMAVTDKGLAARATVLREMDYGAAVLKQAEAGIDWEVSGGFEFLNVEYLEMGSATVNGRVVNAPAYIARQWRLREISFVDVGADPATRAEMLRKDTQMTTDASTPDAVRTVAIDAITADMLRTERPELVEQLGASPGTPAPGSATASVPATIAELDALAKETGGDDAFNMACLREGLSLDAARVRRSASLAADCAALRAKVNELTERLAFAQKHAGIDLNQPTPEAQAASTAKFAGAKGDDPAKDWEACAHLRTIWSDRREAFLAFARSEKREGNTYLTDPFTPAD